MLPADEKEFVMEEEKEDRDLVDVHRFPDRLESSKRGKRSWSSLLRRVGMLLTVVVCCPTERRMRDERAGLADRVRGDAPPSQLSKAFR